MIIFLPAFEVLCTGWETTVQDWPGRIGYRSVGVPASGPMDDLSFRLGNRALGNHEGAAGIEITGSETRLRFRHQAVIMITGAPASVRHGETPVAQWVPLVVETGAVIEIGVPSAGMRSYLLVQGGVDAPETLGSAATVTGGGLSGPTDRSLRAGDLVFFRPGVGATAGPVPVESRPAIGSTWRLALLEGPHGAPEFFTVDDVERLYAASWVVEGDPARTGVRLVGPAPSWARRDGGDAGLHPSQIHSTPCAVGAVQHAGGDLTVLVGPDGPSLSGSATPATIASAHRWMLGQLRPGDTVQFTPVTEHEADDLRRRPHRRVASRRPPVVDGGVLLVAGPRDGRPKLAFRRGGDADLLIEYGEMSLDLALRMRVEALDDAVIGQIARGGLVGVLDTTPGVRSLQLQLDPDLARPADLVQILRALDASLPPTGELSVASRTVHLPLCWGEPDVDLLRRANGLTNSDDVFHAVFAAEYLVLGLGHGSLGAPVATALDPRHRLLSLPCASTPGWTSRPAVGLGGPYLSIGVADHPVNGPLIGDTLPVWAPGKPPRAGDPGWPWRLRSFDRIRWHPVSPDELAAAAEPQGLTTTPGVFSMAAYSKFLADNVGSIAEFQHTQSSAFTAVRRARERSGQSERSARSAASWWR